MTKEINSGKPAAAKSPRRGAVGGLTPTEARERGKESHMGRLARLKDKLPERVYRAVENTPALFQGRYTRALLGELSAKGAIRAHCESCVGYEDVKPRVGGCASHGCPLHAYRPYQPKEEAAEEIPW